MKSYLLIFLKIIIILVSTSAYVYNYYTSDGSFTSYLQFSLLLNFLLVLLFSISTREDQNLNRKYYKVFPISRLKLLSIRAKRLLLNPFYLILIIFSLSILLDTSLEILHRIYYTIGLVTQFGITIIVSFLLYDLLQEQSAENQFFLIPLMLISGVNILVQMDADVKFLLLDFFGGFVFMIYFMATTFDLLVFCGFVFYVVLICLLFKLYINIEN